MSTYVGLVTRTEIIDNKFNFFISDPEKRSKGHWVQTTPNSPYEKLLLKAFTHKFFVQVSSSDRGVTYAMGSFSNAEVIDS